MLPQPLAHEPLVIRPATVRDLQRIVVLEHDCFPAPWPTWMIRQELAAEESSWLLAEVAREVVGYVGLRTAAGEGHISTLGVTPERRGQGLGEALMLAALSTAARAGVERVFLEYRASNRPAGDLYAKLGFQQTRVRRGYYQDNGEDAVEVVLHGLGDPAGRQRLADLTAAWETKHGLPLPVVTSPARGTG